MSVNEDLTAKQVLREAAEYIGEHGWLQGDLLDSDGKACTMGAIHMVCGMFDSKTLRPICSHEAYIAGVALARLDGYLNCSIPEWNDMPGRTVEDVILTLKRAAE